MARRRTVLLAGLVAVTALLVAACGGEEPEVEVQAERPTTLATTRSRPTTTSPMPRGSALARWPLRGTGAPDDAATRRPAVVVKIDNDPHARPQSGLNQADVVYEIEVEGITRFAAVFHSTEVDQVGPIRSARSSDINLLAALGSPLFAWSGANGGVTAEVDGAQGRGLLVNAGHNAAPNQYWRDNNGRYAPHNLYSSIPGLRALGFGGTGEPLPLFAYRGNGERLPDSAAATSGVSIAYRGDGRIANVEYVWDEELDGWARFQTDSLHGDGSPHVDAAGEQVAPANVVILYTTYGVSLSDTRSPQAQTVGYGDALVLTGGGKALSGRWRRASEGDPWLLTTADGEEIELTRGRTWVALPQPGHVGAMSPERAAHLLSLT